METIQQLQDQGDHYANSIDFERRNIETMEEQIHIMRQKVDLLSSHTFSPFTDNATYHTLLYWFLRTLDNASAKSDGGY